MSSQSLEQYSPQSLPRIGSIDFGSKWFDAIGCLLGVTVAKAAEISMDFLQKLIQKQKSATESGAQERDTQYDKCGPRADIVERRIAIVNVTCACRYV